MQRAPRSGRFGDTIGMNRIGHQFEITGADSRRIGECGEHHVSPGGHAADIRGCESAQVNRGDRQRRGIQLGDSGIPVGPRDALAAHNGVFEDILELILIDLLRGEC